MLRYQYVDITNSISKRMSKLGVSDDFIFNCMPFGKLAKILAKYLTLHFG